MKVKNVIIYLVSFSAIIFSGCSEFLDAKPDNTLTYPNTLKDLRAILDNEDFVNHVYPSILEMAADDFQMSYDGFYKLPEVYRDIFIWEDKGALNGDWTAAYRAISLANVVLESLERIKGGNPTERKQLEGEALFLRGWVFFNLAQVYCLPYSINGQNEGLGLVLRLDSDSEVKIGRSTLAETYKQLFSDLNRALELLPSESEYITRPSKLVCAAALARVYLCIGDYQGAERMIDNILIAKQDLLDYNTLDLKLKYPISRVGNDEILYYAKCGSAGYFISNEGTYIAQDLLALYDEHDLRKEVYFEKGAAGVKFRGFYHGDIADFSAVLAMDEVYLTKAECLARRGKVVEALQFLNTLRKHRFAPANYKPLEGADQEEVLRNVLTERRRQLVCRGIRWMDVRRLNQDSRFKMKLERKLFGGPKEEVYVLEPNSLKYAFLIPDGAMEIGHYIQNGR